MTMKAISDDPINTCFIGGIDYSKVCGGPGRDRTYDLSIMSRLLYQLSYGPEIKIPHRIKNWFCIIRQTKNQLTSKVVC